ncbi:MAG: hypothetical protein ACF8PN_08755 [Phycisphaerales bacterium]
MRQVERSRRLVAAVIAALFACPAFAQSLAATEEGHGFGFGYGDERYDNFSAEIDARFDSVTIITDLSDLTEMLQYDAIMIQIRAWGAALSPTEQSNLADYIDTGRRVLFIGENNLWTVWNESFLAVVGGSYLGERDGVATVLNPFPPITDNVTSIELPDCGAALGGLSLFTIPAVTVWDGDGSQNALSVLDVNVFEDKRWNTLDGAVFAGNVAEWLSTGAAGGPSLSINGSCPGQVTASVTGATPGGNVALLYAHAAGSVAIPNGNPCAGTVTGLNATAILVQIQSADASGVATFTGAAPPAACGGVVQALDVSSCAMTNVVGL